MEVPVNRTAVALIAKAPVAGQVKTRFSPPYSPEVAADFAKAFLADTADLIAEFDVDSWCAYLGDESIISQFLPANIKLLAQRGNDLDDRLANVVDDLYLMGYQRVVVVGADCPTITPAHMSKALHVLDEVDVVIGPARDGGYVLLGQRVRDRSLYEGITMSTETVCAETIERVIEARHSLEVLSVLHDLDTVDELSQAWEAGQLAHARHTAALITSVGFSAP